MRPGDLAAFDASFLDRHGAWLARGLQRYFRAEVDGWEHLPDSPFLGVGNHSGAAMIPDTLVWLGAYLLSGRRPRLLTLAHDAMFDAYPRPVATALAKLGGLRANRANALEAARQGFALQVYPGGDFDACRPFARRNDIEFAGRTGYVALAREAGLPLVPVVAAGGHEALVVLTDGAKVAKALGLDTRFRLQVLPVSLSLPWGLWVGPLPGYLPLPTKIRVRVLPPLDPMDGSVEDVDARVRAAMQAALTELTKGRTPWLG